MYPSSTFEGAISVAPNVRACENTCKLLNSKTNRENVMRFKLAFFVAAKVKFFLKWRHKPEEK